MQIVHMTTVHEPLDVRIFHKELLSLHAHGFKVGLIAPGISDTVVEGVTIWAIKEAESRFERFFITGFRMLRKAISLKADLYHFHDPELIWVGLILKALRKKVVYDVHEEVAKQVLSKFWIPKWIRRPLAIAIKGLELFAGLALDGFSVATETIAANFPAQKTAIVKNYPEISISATKGLLPFDQRPFAFIYPGGLSNGQGIQAMVQACNLLPPDMKVLLIGSFRPESLEQEIMALPGWTKIEWLGVLPRPIVLEKMREARCGIVIDLPLPNYLDALSTKMFEYMAAGLPVIASSFLAKDTVEIENCGLSVNPESPEQIADAICYIHNNPALASEMGERGREAVQKRLNWHTQYTQLHQLYTHILAPKE